MHVKDKWGSLESPLSNGKLNHFLIFLTFTDFFFFEKVQAATLMGGYQWF